ncbi:hypothetical protein BDP27DRAFT_1318449 [Rhodocollybia butyracea]|uniref:Uncharacterized protein n=1 Tax=Rhodocollybia butyracea TaxID=206335 RepID=A0A9P5Q132_9AGAR|nr:hypothetical protein BDP27DRAFT_1318449 [Rhodocollybia butyracea]
MIQLLDMNAANVQFCADDSDSESSQRVQFHVIGTQRFFSPKHGKKPSNALVGMKVTGDLPKEKAYLSTSAVQCRSVDEPEWFDNLGPLWLSPSASITFHVKSRSKFSKTTTVHASTETYTLRKLRKMQGSLDRKATIALPLRSQTNMSAEGVLIINLRELSTSNSGMEEYMSIKSAGSQRSSLEDGVQTQTQPCISPLSPTPSTSSGSLSP